LYFERKQWRSKIMDLTPFLDMPDSETSKDILGSKEFAILLDDSDKVLKLTAEEVICFDDCLSKEDLETAAKHVLDAYDSLEEEYESLPEDHPIFPLMLVMCPCLMHHLVHGDYDISLKMRFLKEGKYIQYYLDEDMLEKEHKCIKCMHQKLEGNFVKQDEIEFS
jgi:hypothetical protein